ncbi:hypothetical protein KCU78_g11908, partial [Aureobasidium melanogenum]
MGTRSDPSSHTWTAEAVGNIITTKPKMLKCAASGDFNVLIPEDLLCYFSRYYTALLRGSFSEAGQDNVTLELDGSHAKWFVTWLYSGRFPDDLDYPTLFQLYIFADKTDIPAMRKDIMTHIHKRSHRKGNPPVEDAIEAFDKLPKSSGLVRWVLDRFANHSPVSAMNDNPEFYNHVRSASDKTYEYVCRKTSCGVVSDPCCNFIIDSLGCESDCHHPKDWIKRSQACAYHEHESPEEWKTCAGDDFQQSVDLAYLRGTTATDPVDRLRFASFDNPNSMVYRLGGRP